MSLAALNTFCDGIGAQRPESIDALLVGIAPILPLLDDIPNTVFFIKDLKARYLSANLTLALRCGFKTVQPLLGKTSAEVFPAQLGPRYTEQDQRVLEQGLTLQDQLELHLYGSREPGWCLTHKRPLRGRQAPAWHGRDLRGPASGPRYSPGISAPGGSRWVYP